MFTRTDIQRAFALERAGEPEGWTQKSEAAREEYWYKIDYTNQVPLQMKCRLRLDGVPMEAALKLLTEPKLRNQWDRKVFESETVADNGQYRTIYWIFHMPCMVKDRDMVQYAYVQYVPSEDCYVILYKDGLYWDRPETGQFIRMKTGFSCSVLRRDRDDPNSTQLFTLGNNFYGGWIPDMIMPTLYAKSLGKLRHRLINGYKTT
eukprot:m.2729 g.2729  ORF g.2729 m.2729 type:complete len:205 (+) comp8864_c0_seq1:907-1521(+)